MSRRVTRGDIVAVWGRGDLANKPRPGLIVQAAAFCADHPAFTVCPITSHLTGDDFYRVPIARNAGNGLLLDSEIEIDRVQAVWRYRVREKMGNASETIMLAVDRALRRWLQL